MTNYKIRMEGSEARNFLLKREPGCRDACWKTAKLKTKEKGGDQAVAIAVISMNPDSGSNEAVRDYIALLYCASFCGIWL